MLYNMSYSTWILLHCMRVAEFGSFQEGDMGSTPTGKRVSVSGIDIIRLLASERVCE